MGVRGKYNIKVVKNIASKLIREDGDYKSILDLGTFDIPVEYNALTVEPELIDGLKTLNKFICVEDTHRRLNFFYFYAAIQFFQGSFIDKIDKQDLFNKFRNLYNDNDYKRITDVFDIALESELAKQKNGIISLTEKGKNLLLVNKKLNGHQVFNWDFIQKFMNDFDLNALFHGGKYSGINFLLKDINNSGILLGYNYYEFPNTNDKIKNFCEALFLQPEQVTSIVSNVSEINVIENNKINQQKINFYLAIDKIKDNLNQTQETMELIPTLMDSYSNKVLLSNYLNGQSVNLPINLDYMAVLNKIFGDKVKFRMGVEQYTNSEQEKITLFGTVDNKLVFFKELNKNTLFQDPLNNNLLKSSNQDVISLVKLVSEEQNGN